MIMLALEMFYEPLHIPQLAWHEWCWQIGTSLVIGDLPSAWRLSHCVFAYAGKCRSLPYMIASLVVRRSGPEQVITPVGGCGFLNQAM
jgi:hypothetical protein